MKCFCSIDLEKEMKKIKIYIKIPMKYGNERNSFPSIKTFLFFHQNQTKSKEKIRKKIISKSSNKETIILEGIIVNKLHFNAIL